MLLWVLIFSVFLSSCGQVCIMGQGECPGYNTETQFTISPNTQTQSLDTVETSLAFTLGGGAPNYRIVVSYQEDNLVKFQNGSFEADKQIETSNYTSESFTLVFNTTTVIDQELTSSNNKVTITVTDKNGKTASATITVSKS